MIKLHVAIIPPPGNQGEDLNWINYLVAGHPVEDAVSKEQLAPIFKEFFALPKMDEESDEWEDLDSKEQQALLAKLLEYYGYTVFPPTTGIRWCC